MFYRKYLTPSILIIVIILIFVSFQAKAIDEQYKKFDNTTGLTDNHITDQLIDKYSYLWIATEKGLNKFDGYNYIYFTKENGKLQNNHIHSLTQHANNIYVATKNAISIIDINTNQSKIVFLEKDKSISKIYYVSTNQLAVYYEDGTFILYTNRLEVVKKYKFKPGAFCEIAEYNNYLFLTALGENKICRLNLSTLKIENKENIEIDFENTELKYIKNFGLLYTNQNGMYKYNNILKSFVRLDNKFNGVSRITPLNDTIVCLLYEQFKIKFYNFKKDKFLAQEFESPGNSFVQKINILNGDVILGTNQGVIVFQLILKAFDKINIDNAGNYIPRAIIESKENDIYFFNYNKILCLKNGSEKPTEFSNDNNIQYTAIEKDDDIYYGTEGLGLYKISKKTHQTKCILQKSKFSNSAHITSLYLLNDHTLLIGCSPGLFVYDIDKNTLQSMTIYTKGKDLYKLNYGYNLHELNYRQIVSVNSEIWMSTNKGIVIFDHDFHFKEVINKSSSDDSKQLICDTINYIYQQNENTVWIATDNGFQKYIIDTKQFYNPIRNLEYRINNKIIAILPDEFGRLWMPTYFGLLLYNPRTDVLTTYHKHDGLVNDEYNYSSYCRLKNGNIILGGINGYQYIYPSFIDQEFENIKINITDIVRLENDNTFVSLNNTNFIRLNLEDDYIQVRFTTNEYAHTESLSYFYRTNENSSWISTNKLPIINLSYLPKGTEYLYIKVIDDDNLSEQSITKIPVYINTKTYKEWWFIPSVLLIFILLISTILFQTNRVRNSKLKEIEKAKTEELLIQNLSKQKELNSLKTKFIRLVSHEYRTPLTGIATSLDLMDMLLANNNSDELRLKEKRHMKNIRLQVDRMSKLIKGVQSLNRMEDFIAKMNLEEADIAAYAKYHIELLVPSNFTLKFHCNSESIMAKFDKDIMLQMLSNVISNSVKYSYKERKEIIVSCEELYDNTYSIVLQDFGVGIPEKDLPLVFDTFYRSQTIENIQGIGLGLSITKQLIEQMNGTIEIHSIVDYGTTVTIKFPMNA